MAIYAFGDAVPEIHPSAFIHPESVIIGNVTIGEDSSVWAGTVLRGDHGHITIGQRTSVQDGTVVHTTPFWPTVVGDDCVIGHIVHLEGCTVENFSQVSSGAIVLHNAVIGSGAIVAANAVVLNNTVVPSGALAVGAPCVIKEGRARAEDIRHAVDAYVRNAREYPTMMRRID